MDSGCNEPWRYFVGMQVPLALNRVLPTQTLQWRKCGAARQKAQCRVSSHDRAKNRTRGGTGHCVGVLRRFVESEALPGGLETMKNASSKSPACRR